MTAAIWAALAGALLWSVSLLLRAAELRDARHTCPAPHPEPEAVLAALADRYTAETEATDAQLRDIATLADHTAFVRRLGDAPTARTGSDALAAAVGALRADLDLDTTDHGGTQ